jgi:hypothetical protein
MGSDGRKPNTAERAVKLKANHFGPNCSVMPTPFADGKRVMDLMSAFGVGFVAILLWFCMQWRQKVMLDKKIARLAAIAAIRTDEHLGYELTRGVTIGDIIRELPPLNDKQDTRQ